MHNIFSPLVTHRAGYSGLGRDNDDVAIHLKHSFFLKTDFTAQHQNKYHRASAEEAGSRFPGHDDRQLHEMLWWELRFTAGLGKGCRFSCGWF